MSHIAVAFISFIKSEEKTFDKRLFSIFLKLDSVPHVTEMIYIFSFKLNFSSDNLVFQL